MGISAGYLCKKSHGFKVGMGDETELPATPFECYTGPNDTNESLESDLYFERELLRVLEQSTADRAIYY